MYEFIGAKNQYYRIKLNYKCEFNGTDNKCDLIQKPLSENITSIHLDNPGRDWLKNERQYAYDKYVKGDLIPGSATAYVEGRLPTSIISALPGLNDEQMNKNILHDYKAEPIRESVKNEGVKEPILINVNFKGQAFINEGNHRAALAKEFGLKDVPIEIRYFAGGELVPGPWTLNKFGNVPEKFKTLQDSIKDEEFISKEVPKLELPVPSKSLSNKSRTNFLKHKYNI